MRTEEPHIGYTVKVLGNTLREARGNRSVREIAKKAGISPIVYRRIERGKVYDPQPAVVERLEKVLGVETDVHTITGITNPGKLLSFRVAGDVGKVSANLYEHSADQIMELSKRQFGKSLLEVNPNELNNKTATIARVELAAVFVSGDAANKIKHVLDDIGSQFLGAYRELSEHFQTTFQPTKKQKLLTRIFAKK